MPLTTSVATQMASAFTSTLIAKDFMGATLPRVGRGTGRVERGGAA